MKTLRIIREETEDGVRLHAIAVTGDWTGEDAQNTAMNVLRFRPSVLIWDEGTWDDYQWA